MTCCTSNVITSTNVVVKSKLDGGHMSKVLIIVPLMDDYHPFNHRKNIALVHHESIKYESTIILLP